MPAGREVAITDLTRYKPEAQMTFVHRVGGVLVGLIMLAASTSRADCSKDTDCKGNRVCDEGRCVAPDPGTRSSHERSEPESKSIGRANVSFVGDEDRQYVVSVGGATCATPCALQLKPGPQQFLASPNEGEGFSSILMVPDNGGAFRVSKGKRPYTGAGIALTVVGAVVASSFWAIGLGCDRSSGCLLANMVFWPLSGAGMFFTGVGLLGYGASHSTASGARLILSSARSLDESAVRLTSVAVLPAQLGSGATAGIGFAF